MVVSRDGGPVGFALCGQKQKSGVITSDFPLHLQVHPGHFGQSHGHAESLPIVVCKMIAMQMNAGKMIKLFIALVTFSLFLRCLKFY